MGVRPPQQCLLALPLRESRRGHLWEALHARALRVRVIQVLPAVLGGRLREEEELVQLPVALRGRWVAGSPPLSHHASHVGALNAVL